MTHAWYNVRLIHLIATDSEKWLSICNKTKASDGFPRRTTPYLCWRIHYLRLSIVNVKRRTTLLSHFQTARTISYIPTSFGWYLVLDGTENVYFKILQINSVPTANTSSTACDLAPPRTQQLILAQNKRLNCEEYRSVHL